MGRSRRWSVARQVFTLQVVVVLVLVALATALAYVDARDSQLDGARTRSVDIAQTVADSPAVARALRSDDPAERIQPFAEEVRRDTGTDFVVVMGLDRTRYSHPDPAQLGRPFIGDLGAAPEGEVFTQEATGTLGPSMRAVVPVVEDHEVVALVSVGITLERVADAVWERLARVALVAVVLLLLGWGGAWLINRRLRRQTHGMGEQEITRLYEFYDAMLHAVREGLVLLDTNGRLQLANDEAVRLLGLPAEARGRTLTQLGVPASLAAALDGHESSDEIHLLDDRVLLVSQAPATWEGRVLGSVVTLRDHTELTEVSGRLDTVQQLSETLRAQTHEAANQLHTVVSLIEMGRPEEAVGFATSRVRAAQGLADRVHGVGEEPVLAAILLGKTGVAAERGVDLVVAEGSAVEGLPLDGSEIVTVIGNLLDNAFDAVSDGAERRVLVRLEADDRWFALDVEDSGPGLDEEAAARAFERGWSTKPGDVGVGRGLGLALVAQVVRRHGGTIEAGRSELGGARFSVRIGEEP